ncbi:MAG TPA: acetylornithine deacetylase [Alphaproteobacteria bacterium]|nr:acetylornithine deacetylase [Alphaproteobacteria bacterium]
MTTTDTNPASLDMLRRLVGFPTVSRDSNLELIRYVVDYLAGHGIEARLTHDDTGKKANLFATIGPAEVPGVVLSGHTDVVPVDDQPWSSDPFKLVERDGRLYGRGAVDMKGFVAVILAFVPRFAAAGLKKPVHLSLSYDEEIGCVGVRRLIDDVLALPVRPEMCIVGEPTRMRLMLGHKGKVNMRVRVRGSECHSSLAPQGVNAVEYAAELVSFLRRMARRKAAMGPFDELFDVAHTTVHTGIMAGGTALNIVPKDCRVDFEIRAIPEDDLDEMVAEVKAFARTELEPMMKAVDPAAGFGWEVISAIPGLDTRPDEEVAQLVSQLTGRNDFAKVAFGTEGGLFQQQGGIPTVVCGPGDIDQAHKPDEFIETSQLIECERFMERLIERLAAA